MENPEVAKSSGLEEYLEVGGILQTEETLQVAATLWIGEAPGPAANFEVTKEALCVWPPCEVLLETSIVEVPC